MAGTVLNGTAALLLDHHRAWSGSGKWLPRRLLDADGEHGGALLQGHRHLRETGDPAPLTDATVRVLGLVGGPLHEGYRRTWRGVIDSVAAGAGR
ncbi:hypothetical protein [Streptomyces sp. NPDC005828]|uniref:hypothetical protein n=1 Tax=Streptomyces sp. NPDC005828 TaxID=3157071 RepID=UPI0033C07155